MRPRCLICASLFEGVMGREVCNGCLQELLRARFQGCARCGQASCVGTCGKLGEIASFESILRLQPPWSELLIAAKDGNSAAARYVFEKVMALFLERKLVEIIAKFQPSHIVIAPLRVRRVTESDWHPALLFERLLSTLTKNLSTKILFPVIDAERQAHKSMEKRLDNLRQSISPIPWRCWDVEESGMQQDSGHVLFCDDVITSGGSVINAFRGAPEGLRLRHWHVLTIFRTPIQA